MNKYEKPLRDLIADIDYGLHMSITQVESGGPDRFPELATRFTLMVDGANLTDHKADYEMVRDAVIEAFNPEDDDASEPGIMVTAIVAARAFIETRPCECDVLDDDEEPCARCTVLGRFKNVPVER